MRTFQASSSIGPLGKHGCRITRTVIGTEESDFTLRTVGLFGTSAAGKGIEVKGVEDVLSTKETCIKGKFFCKGKFFLTNRGKPSHEDLDQARTFAKTMMK